ncbi:MAG: hypothetical protein ABT10_12485 [Novosphingobium sp. SCN 63-17]|nr:MAG: hypothetical protein ABT10_12485 [Novosphingobium sp. SCN 63-17]OJX95158.1 MAG: hypothetical protein BGP00_09895 [Novosphingobium sp. 63-713]
MLQGASYHHMNTLPHTSLEPSAWLAAIIEGSEDAIVSKSLEGKILSWNGGAQKLFGYSPQEAIGQPITLIIPEDRRHEEDAIIANIKAGIMTRHFETVRKRKDGSLIDVSLTISPVRDATGRLIGASKVARDITQSRRMAEQRQLILHEMNHRIKNLFMLANGLVALCRREAETIDGFAADLQSRLVALAQAHEASARLPQEDHRTGTISLRDLLETILKPFESRSNQRIEIRGTHAMIGPRSLPSIALLLHELATNSAKYGALRSVEGLLRIEMAIIGPRVRLIWAETGLPAPLSAPLTKGFGTRLETMATRVLNAAIHRDWQPDRLVIDMSFDGETLSS